VCFGKIIWGWELAASGGKGAQVRGQGGRASVVVVVVELVAVVVVMVPVAMALVVLPVVAVAELVGMPVPAVVVVGAVVVVHQRAAYSKFEYSHQVFLIYIVGILQSFSKIFDFMI